MAKDYDIAKKTVQDEILDAVQNMETSLTGELTANVVKSIQRGYETTLGTINISKVNSAKSVVLINGGTWQQQNAFTGGSDVAITSFTDTSFTTDKVANANSYKYMWTVVEFY